MKNSQQRKIKQLNALELRNLTPTEAGEMIQKIDRLPLYLILDDIYDTYNIGGLFRLADALAVSKMCITGPTTDTPPNAKIKKASIGTYKIVPWEYYPTATDAIKQLRTDVPDITIVAVEQDSTSIPYTDFTYTSPLAIVVGNETRGCLPETLKNVDHVLEIPMHGLNTSLNVIVSAAIVSYHASLEH